MVRRSLPSSVRKLRRLQTLDLRVLGIDEPLRNVAKWRLGQLRHLYLPSYFMLRDEKLLFENVSSLRTLVGVSTSYPGFSRLTQMTNLTKLKVCNEKDWDGGVTFNNLRSLTVIQEVFLGVRQDVIPIISSCPRIHKLKVVGRIEKLPEHNQFSPELVKLTLKDTWHRSDMMPTLEKLPKLKILRLVNAFIVKEFVCSKGGFPRLESLYLSDVKIKEWRMEEGAFSRLRHLTLDKCWGLRALDAFRHNAAMNVRVFGGSE